MASWEFSRSTYLSALKASGFLDAPGGTGRRRGRDLEPRLKGAERALMLLYALMADNEATAHPSLGYCAGVLGMHSKSVSAARRRLVRLGLMECVDYTAGGVPHYALRLPRDPKTGRAWSAPKRPSVNAALAALERDFGKLTDDQRGAIMLAISNATRAFSARKAAPTTNRKAR